jgi:hypothetical protein
MHVHPLATLGRMDEILFSSKNWMKSFSWMKKQKTKLKISKNVGRLGLVLNLHPRFEF